MMKKENKIFIISGPSGVGKTTVTKSIIRRLSFLKTTVTFTTRTKRLGKKEDKRVIHVSEDQFRKKVNRGDFLEWAVVHDNFYGTDGQVVIDRLKKNSLLMNIDVQGALQIKEKMPRQTVLIFIKAKNLNELVKRIAKREKMPKNILAIRLKNARKELALAKKYQHVVVNETGKVAQTIKEVEEIIKNELAR
ncbi:MAG: guanylate kinase [Candidatus Buchananbacteria bacterium RIFCSPHIGHO2_02_FULL_45_11b]|uniref:Guanylate kinase n=1 Tax=Candidatus Buchananbacteria bacterium RIFCSPHIGHO2_02_FULL_45_11b TaxID=1797541 RepID=A0A1G1YJA9_9BACT|nr:MAG: guanylate kinase [Candidatus Buchananbacteria bacterium RIFCSPHIGHO2_02_FULL_45_11b]